MQIFHIYNPLNNYKIYANFLFMSPKVQHYRSYLSIYTSPVKRNHGDGSTYGKTSKKF